MVENIRMHHKTKDGFVPLHPETNINQVLDSDTGHSLRQILNEATNLRRTIETPFKITCTEVGQKIFTFEDPYFDLSKNNVKVHINGEFSYPIDEYIVIMGEVYPQIIFKDHVPINVDDTVHVIVSRDTVIAPTNFGIYRTQTVKHTVTATIDNQITFDFKDIYFRKNNDSTIVFLQSDLLIEDQDYITSETGSIITLFTGVPKDTKIHIIVLRDAPTTNGININVDLENIQDELTYQSQSISEIDNKIVTHLDNTTNHITGAERISWNDKIDKSLLTAAGDIIYASAANTPARLAKGVNGQVLTLSGGIPIWGTASGAKIASGTWSDTTTNIISNNVYTKSIPIGFSATRGRLIVRGLAPFVGAIIFFNTDNTKTISFFKDNVAVKIFNKSLETLVIGNNVIGTYINITDCYINGQNLTIIFKNTDPNNNNTLNVTSLIWEVEG